MTCEEFSDQFDVLYNNIMSNAAPGLNEYEKSVFLTKAQNEIVKNYFSAGGNKYKEGFDGSPKRQIDFSMLMKQASLSTTSSSSSFDPRARTYKFPTDLFIVVNESILLKSGSDVRAVRQVIPISYDEYTRLMSKPYKEPLKNQAWRLITGKDSSSALPELIINSSDKNYTVVYNIRYIKSPNPIIVADLDSTVGDVTIDGKSSRTECELDKEIHMEILQRAVELAKASYASDQSGQAQFQNQVTVGQRSE